MPKIAVSRILWADGVLGLVSGKRVTLVADAPGSAAHSFECATAILAFDLGAAEGVFVSSNTDKETLWLRPKEGEDGKAELVKEGVFKNKKRIASLVCDREGRVILSDKSGVLEAWEVADRIQSLQAAKPAAGTFLLGHCSQLTDAVLLSDKLLASAGKDGKIRISRLPESYCIQSFCLGHRGFISRLVGASPTHVLSGGADGTLRLWDAMTGSEISQMQLVDVTDDPWEEADAKNVVVPMSFCRATGRAAVAVSEKLLVVKVDTREPSLAKVHEVVLASEVLDAAFDGDQFLYVATLEEPYLEVYEESDGKFSLSANEERRERLQLLRDAAVSTGTDTELAVDKQIRSWQQYAEQGRVVKHANKRRKANDA